MRKPAYMFFAVGISAIASIQTAKAEPNMRVFHAAMSAEDETKYTESPGVGDAEFTLNLDTKQIKWTISFSHLSDAPVSVAIYGPAQPGANGQMMFSLAGKSLKSPITGSGPVTESQIQYLLYGWTYVNVVTKKFENGEVRGQLDIKQAAQK